MNRPARSTGTEQVPPAGSTTSGAGNRNADSETMQRLLDELNRPLEDERATAAGKNESKGRPLRHRIAATRDRRRELARARQAAARAFGISPHRSVRKQASMLMGAGALSLAAFTAPDFTPGDNALEMETNEREGIRLPPSAMVPSDTFKRALIEEEGVRYRVYRDVAGYPTVGVGHLVTPHDGLRVGDRIDEEQVLAFLERDLATAADGVRSLVGDLPLFQHEFDALLDLVYNVGEGGVGERRSPRLNEAIANGDYAAMADELRYTTARGKIARGLEYRSERRAQIFTEASYEDPRETAPRRNTA